MNEWKMAKDVVFIASGGRTGTQFFGEGLSHVIEDCFSAHEPDIFFGLRRGTLEQIRRFGIWHMVIGRLLGMAGVRVLGHRLMTGNIAETTCLARISRSRRRYHRGIRQSLVVESNGQWWYLVDQLQKIWPRAKVIAIIRDPRDWVRSWINKRGRYDKWDRAGLSFPGRLTPSKIGQTDWAERWNGMDTFGKLAWEWRTIYSHLDINIEHSSNSRMFRFEDIFASDSAAMQELVEFAATHGGKRYVIKDLSGFADTVKNASTGGASDWRYWSVEQVRIVHELCGPLMERYGYGHEPEWLAKLEEAQV